MISVCLATYNGERFIKEQLDSILCQLDKNDEVILSDDGSKDQTLDIVKAYNDPRIHVYHNQNHGFVYNFENAISHASGDYIFLSDQDDIWFPNKVARCLDLLQDHIIVNHNSLITDKDGKGDGNDFFSMHHSKGGFWQTIWRNSYSGCCMAFRKELLEWALPFPKNIASHDIWLGLIAEKKGTSCFLDEPLIYYRRHGHNASSTACKSELGLIRKLKYRSYMLLHSIKR